MWQSLSLKIRRVQIHKRINSNRNLSKHKLQFIKKKIHKWLVTIVITAVIHWGLNYVFNNLHCCCSVAKSCPSLWPSELQHASLLRLSLTSQSLFKLISTELVVPSNHLILWCPLLLPLVCPIITIFSLPNNLHTLSHLIFFQFNLSQQQQKMLFFSFYSNKHIIFVIY